MQNFISTFSSSKSFQFVNEQICWEQRSPHRHDCHDPPHAVRVGRHDDRSPPRRLAAVVRSDPWKIPPAQVGFRGDATWRRRSPWVVGPDRWNIGRGEDYLPRDRRGEDGHVAGHVTWYAGLIESTAQLSCFHEVFRSRRRVDQPSVVKSQISAPGHDPGKDVRMPKTIAVVKLPEILGNGSSHLVKLAGKIDSFSLLLRETPEGELKRSIEVQFHSMVFATRKEIRKYCPRYRSLPGEGILDFNTDCTSGQLEPGDLGKAPPPKRGRLCEKCCFFAGIPEEQSFEMTLSTTPQDLVFVV